VSELRAHESIMRLVTAILAKDEAAPDRYLRAVLQNAAQWSATVLVLDDHSTDETVAICREEGAIVVERADLTPAWGHESAARKELWDLAVEAAGLIDGWVLFQDCDMLLSADPRPLLATEELNTWCWPLLDLWDSPDRHRTDGYWQASVTPRPWLVKPDRVPKGWVAEWPDRGVHCGHIPKNFPMAAAVAPPSFRWFHWAYVKREHREAKARQYLSLNGKLTEFERAHAESILDAS